MKYKWDLTKLFSNKESFYGEMTCIRDLVKKISSHREIKIDGVSLYNLINDCFIIREKNYKTLLYASLCYYLDIQNESNIKMKNQAEELDLYVNSETIFIEELIGLITQEKLDLFYVECPDLVKYKYYISNITRCKNHLDNDSSYSNDLSISQYIVKYNDLFSKMLFGNIDNVELNNSNLGKYLISDDREVRKKVFSEVNNSYKSKSDEYFDILKSIINLRKDNCNATNFNSVLEKELFKDNIEEIFVENLIKSISNNIYLMNKYLKIKMNYLNIKDPSFYDINVPICDCSESFDLENALGKLRNIFNIFGDKYIEAYDYLLSNKYLDLDVDENKHPSIVFSWNNYSFMNYKDNYVDLKNLAHEFGHIINNYLSSDLPFVYNDSSVFIGEVSSLVNEILLNEYLYQNASDKNNKIFYLTKIIENFISQVYRQIMYTEFENVLYNSKNMDLEFCNNEYLSLVRKYYGNILNIDDSIKYEWMRVGHLFRWSYYVYKYASGYVLAFNVVKKIKEGNLENEFIDFLSSGCSCNNVELLRKLNIDLYNEDLINNSFDLLNNYILELEDLLEVE